MQPSLSLTPSATAGWLLMLSTFSACAATPVSSTTALFEADSTRPGTFFWMSRVSPTIFGQDATVFDFYLHSSPALAKEAIETYAQAVATGSEDARVAAFLNATMAGTMTTRHASDNDWKCLELGGAMASTVSSCQGSVHSVAERDLAERSRFKWIQSAAHVSSTFAMNALAGVLGNAMYNNLPSSPRSICNTADGTNACFSWSRVEATFNEGYARSFVEDALSAVDFNRYSGQADSVLTKRQTAADVCLSNRATGCT